MKRRGTIFALAYPFAIRRMISTKRPAETTDTRARLIFLVLAGAYSYFVVVSHDVAQAPALQVESEIGTAQWNRIAGLTGLLLATLVTWAWLRRVWAKPPRTRALIWVGIASILAIACHELLMIKTIEWVHFLQYGILTLLVVPVVAGISEAAVVAFLVGLIDEWYQYQVLHPWQRYLDLNDIVMNLVGCMLAASLLASVMTARIRARTGWRRPASTLALVILGLATSAFGAGWIGNYTDTGRFPLQRWARPADPEPYVAWIQESGRDYHRLLPWEAATLLLLMGGTFVAWPCDE